MMNESFKQDIRKSGYLHRPLPIYREHSMEKEQAEQAVLSRETLFDAAAGESHQWIHHGVGSLRTTGQAIQLVSPSIMPHWPEGAPADGDYVNFGSAWMTLKLPQVNWEAFNRITLNLHPDFHGVPNAYIMIKFKNEGAIPIPDLYHREGVHGVNMDNHEWNTVHLDIQELPRDVITELTIGYYLNGKEKATGDAIELALKDITLEKVDGHHVSKGWVPKQGEIVYSHSGYSADGSKTAFAVGLEGECFQLLHEVSGAAVFTGQLSEMETEWGTFQVMDFSEFKQNGRYTLSAGGMATESFAIGAAPGVWHASVWKSLNFIFCERCGYPVPGIHGSCHADIVANHKGTLLSFNGGWHDAGDVSQQLIQSAEVTHSLFEMADQVKPYDEDLYLRLLEEGEWGLDFMLKTRFGDGYRATSAGITRWTDGRIGNMDDAEARVHNQAYENFFCAGIEAYIHSRILHHPALSKRLLEIAKEDFQYALEEFKKHGFDQKPIFWEHTYQSSESLYMATASWAASMLYKATKDGFYAEKAAEFIAFVRRSQELEGIEVEGGAKLSGFFYRNPSKEVVQHFNHQAREHLYMMAFSAIHETQGEHPEAGDWLASIEAYAEYVKRLAAYTLPYPMLASGVYHVDEHQDDKSFNYQHLLIDHQAKEDYGNQLKAGVKLNDKYYLRRFPVWFSFRGNNAIMLSQGKAASVAGLHLKDKALLDIAEGQLRWIVGQNPFGQSMMHGEGYRYAQQYSVLCGEMTGELPVGVQTFGNEDEPYWPQFNNATYKEVWTGVAGKWMSIVADLYAAEV